MGLIIDNQDNPEFGACWIEMRRESFYLSTVTMDDAPEFEHADIDGLIACLTEVRRRLDEDSPKNGGKGYYKQ